MTYAISRIILFGLILTLGTLTALRMGETASLALTTLPQTGVEALAADAGDQVWYAGLIRPDQATQLYLTKDRGQHWQAIGTGLAEVAITDLVVHPADSNVLYAGTKGGDLKTHTDLLLSVDGGQTWQEFPLKLPANPERQLPDVTALAVAPTGAGKSSLINTLLLPMLREAGFINLPVGRVSGSLPESIEAVTNIYTFNLLLSLDQNRHEPANLVNTILTDYLQQTRPKPNPDLNAPPQARMLIIDQFEEILTTNIEY
jgi:hypothetical protein